VNPRDPRNPRPLFVDQRDPRNPRLLVVDQRDPRNPRLLFVRSASSAPARRKIRVIRV
jgi:hypothetical protein